MITILLKHKPINPIPFMIEWLTKRMKLEENTEKINMTKNQYIEYQEYLNQLNHNKKDNIIKVNEEEKNKSKKEKNSNLDLISINDKNLKNNDINNINIKNKLDSNKNFN
jgi:hypothetical protein